MKMKLTDILILTFVGLALCCGSIKANAAANLVVTPLTPIPSKVVESTTVSGIQYQISNTGDASATVTFTNLNTLGKTFTTTCGTLAASANCLLNITFAVPALPAGATSEFYPHTAFVLGGASRVPFSLSTTIVESAGSIDPTVNIRLSDGTTCTGTYTVTLTGSDSAAHEYDDVACGTSTLTPGLPGDTYNAAIAPSSTTIGDNTYDAPAAFSYHLAKAGDTATFTYQLNQDVAVDTDITAPNIGSNTPTVACTGAASYSHEQGAGTTPYDDMKPGQYTCTAASYVGTDTETYNGTISNPVTIDTGHTTITITYTALPPASTAVSTVLTTPNLPTGNTVSCTLENGDDTYTHNQPTGTAHFDQVVDATDYTFSCVSYTVGADTYSMTTQTNVVIDAGHNTLTGVFSKNAPPGTNYDWNVDHLTSLKNANVFLVSWGGGHTTAPVKTSTNPDPNPKLISDIATYEGSPTTILPGAAVQGFPGYIAMGTISEPSTPVTDQLKEQNLDFTNKYEAPFGNSPGGCYYQQQNANGASGGQQRDYWYNANQTAGLQPLNWTTTPSPSNLIPAGTYVVAGDLYTVNQSLSLWDKVKKLFGATVNAGFIQYVGKIGTPIQVDATHVTIPETYIALPLNTSIGRPNLANNQTVTFSVDTHVSTNVTFGAQSPVSGTSLINLAENMCGSYFYTTGGYTPVVNDVAAQAAAVKAHTSHNLVGGIVFYTVPFSVSNDQIIDSLLNDYNVQSNLYNLATEALLMQAQYTNNNINMALLLNPDTTNIFQNCAQWYCAIQWKKGLSQDTTGILVQIPNLGADLNAVVDRLVAYGQLSSGAATTLKALIISSNVLAIPSGSGLTAPGMQNFFAASNLLVRHLAPNVPFGYGFNIYDNANPMMNVGACPAGTSNCSYQTASITWIHKVNHSGYSSLTVEQAVQMEANKDATFMKDLNFADYDGNPYSAYAPDYMFRDRFEDDVIYSEIGDGYLLNGVDLDTYAMFVTDINNGGIIKPLPTMLWQWAGASLQIQGATWPSNALGDDMVDWVFGNPQLKNDFSNIAACTTITPSPATLPCNWYGTSFVGNLNNNVYFTKNSNVTNTIDYLKLTSNSP
jgi:hypothetical protein